MYLNIRPSKIFFRRKFDRWLKKLEPYNKVLDCACAKAKNRPLFHQKEYHGIDISQKSIDIANEKYKNDSSCFLYQDDMTDLKSEVLKQKFDLVISSHTLYWLDDNKKEKALNDLTKLLKKEGSFILQCGKSELVFAESLKKQFQSSEIHTYRGTIGKRWELWLAKVFKNDRVPDIALQVSPLVRYFLFSVAFILSYLDVIGKPDQALLLLYQKKN